MTIQEQLERALKALTEINKYNHIRNDLEAYLSEVADYAWERMRCGPIRLRLG